MKYRFKASGLVISCAALGAFAASHGSDGPALAKKDRSVASREYVQAIQQTASMVNDGQARHLARQFGLDLLNLTWEDTGRFKNSSVGPNISDMTIQVGAKTPDGQFNVTCMPVFRYPNFSDKTCDIDPRDFTLLVGNEHGQALRRVSLYEFLSDTKRFLSRPGSWPVREATLFAPRDEKVLVSAQACFLPVPRQGLATFNPVLFNYMSTAKNPAVLTILATREGTSTTIIDNTRDAFQTGAVWGQRLFHNQNGMRASLTGKRESEVVSGTRNSNPGNEDEISGANMVLLIQVPLIHEAQNRMSFGAYDSFKKTDTMAGAARRGGSDVENAVIGHGAFEGVFTEMDNLGVRRDPRYPVRVTVQFYKATSNGVVSAADVRSINEDIQSVYSQSDSVGSLVCGGDTGRITEYEGAKVEPASWWHDFWQRHYRDTGDTPEVARAKLMKLLGRDYETRPVTDLYLRRLMRHPKSR